MLQKTMTATRTWKNPHNYHYSDILAKPQLLYKTQILHLAKVWRKLFHKLFISKSDDKSTKVRASRRSSDGSPDNDGNFESAENSTLNDTIVKFADFNTSKSKDAETIFDSADK